MQRKIKGLLLDTDIGGDVDDEVAVMILQLLRDTNFKLLAISTVHTEPEIKAQIVEKITKEFGLTDIPVFSGVGCKRSDTKEKFIEQCPLFPPFFGYPAVREVSVPEHITVADLANRMLVAQPVLINEIKEFNIMADKMTEVNAQTILAQDQAMHVVTEMGYKAKAVSAAQQAEIKEDLSNQDKMWYPKFAKAYKEKYGDHFQKTRVQTESAPEMIARLASEYTEKDKLTIVAIGPLHNIEAALKINPAIAKKIKLVTMGGLYPLGYNWLIAPETTAYVLSRVETEVISSQFINANKFSISKEELATISANVQSTIGKAFLQSCQNWYKGDFFKKDGVYLYDPITLALAANPDQVAEYEDKVISFPCLDENGRLKPEFKGKWYNQKDLDDKIIKVHSANTDSQASNLMTVRFITKVKSPELLRNRILSIVTERLTSPAISTLSSKPNSFFRLEESGYKKILIGAATLVGAGFFAYRFGPSILSKFSNVDAATIKPQTNGIKP